MKQFCAGKMVGFTLVCLYGSLLADGPIVINEIHCNPDVATERVEFVELYNAGTNTVNVGGWFFSSGLSYTLPATNIAAGGYLVVAQDPAALAVKFPGTVSVGPYNADRTSGLSKYGDKLTLCDAAGEVMDEVNYQMGFPWPTVGDPPGYSMELMNPKLDNNLGGSWRASVAGGGVQPANVLIQSNSVWKYLKGTAEASTPATLWRQPDFNDSAWQTNRMPMGYGETWLTTLLDDMPTGYLSVFFRKTFVVNDPVAITSLLLEAQYDDGFKVWINGVNVHNANITTNELAFDGTAGAARESAAFELLTLNNPGSLVPGTNIIAIQAHNTCLSPCSSDFFLDIQLRAQTGASGRGPTPGKLNSVYAQNAPPQIRQVEHHPQQPAGGEPVRITAKVSDPDGVASVQLQYQIVNPGSYIELTDAAYTNAANWITVPMNDSGVNGDEAAGDGVFSVEIPASVQVHRRLIRYLVTVSDTLGATIRVPYGDDPQPNFAYFIYSGAPAWQGAVQPGVAGSNGVVRTVASNEMSRLPVYHLIGKNSTIAQATWLSRYGGDLYQWAGTLVYDGKVYDHIHYRARGGVWRYSMVKNMWKFDLNRGHDFEARDNWGRKYKTGWTKLNLGSCIQQGDFWHRGEQGMFESVGLRLFQLAGVLAPNTTHVTLRVIDDANEANPANQYEGDFWGVYLAVEQENGRLLEEHNLPDSNFYKMEGGTGELNNQGPNDPGNKADLNYLLSNYTGATETWWRTNWNLAKYYSYQSIVQGIHHYDICYDKNFFYYIDPRTRLWEVAAWDLDLTWANNMYDSGCGGKDRLYQRIFDEVSPAKPGLALEYRNRVREIRDLLFNTEQAYQLIDEHANLLRGTSNAPSILDADRAQWDYNPKMIDSTYTPNLGKAQQGYFYQWTQESGVSKDFNGCVQLMKNYVVTRSAVLDGLATDALKPNRPTLSYTGATNYPANHLTFRSSAFSPGGAVFGAIQWRLAEVSDYTVPPHLDPEPRKYEIAAVWESGRLTNFNADLTIPSQYLRVGQRYRVRVQHVDATGRSSNWSLPVEFVTAPPDNSADLVENLRITEVMFHPAAGGSEYLELYNRSATMALDLTGVRFTKGMEFIFPSGTMLAPGAYLVLANTADLAGFRAYYNVPPEVTVLGPFSKGNLDNNGEQITLRTAAGGTDILSFTFSDGRGWPLAATGAGHSLVLVDAAVATQNEAGDYGGNWRASTYGKGSPGRAEPAPVAGPVLNEIAANTSTNNGLASDDWIELYNPTAAPITLSAGWYLSDDPTNLTKWMIPAGTVVPALGWVSFDENTGFHSPTNTGFGINKDGEQIFLSFLPGTSGDRVVDAVRFKAQEQGWSWGRYPDGAPWWRPLFPPTREGANVIPPATVLVSEIHYHPPDIGGTNDNAADEFMELKNVSGQPINLYNTNAPWRLDGDAELVFPSNLTLAPGATMLLVSFDPANAPEWERFCAQYALASSNLLAVGPYSRNLPNRTGRVALEKAQAADASGALSWGIVDEVIYADLAPWPCGTDGQGNSLQRVDPAGTGSDAFNWMAQAPTPGADRPNVVPGVASFVAQPASRIVATNASVAFNVSLCGTPPYTYQWYFNGNPLPGRTNAELILAHVQLTDSGNYAVVVANQAGAATSAVAALVVQLPPTISAQPQSQVVTGYTAVSLSVTASGTPPFQYQWRHQGVDLPGATNASLSFALVTSAQAGSYEALVRNAAGTVLSSNAALVVYMPPRITTSLTNLIKATNGGLTTMAISATGDAPLYYQWYFNGEPLVGAISQSLVMSNVAPAVEGNYSILVSNRYGTDLSPATFLKILVLPGFALQPTNQTVTLGSDVVMHVISTGSQPLNLRWDKVVPVGTLNEFSDTLRLRNAALTDGGLYKAVAINELRTNGQSSIQFSLAVVAPPKDTLALAGSNVVVRAYAGGLGMKFQWQCNGTNLPSATSTNLTLTAVTPDMAGVYTLVVTNGIGSSASNPAVVTRYSLTLTVQSVAEAPRILAQPAHQMAMTNENALLTVLATGTEALSYQWYFNATNALPKGNSWFLALTNIQAGNFGNYQVVISNMAGTVTSEVATLSLPPTSIKLELATGRAGLEQAFFQFGAVSNQSYTVQYREALSTNNPWLRYLDISPVPTNRQVGVTNTGAGPMRFYRVATPQLPPPGP